MTLTLGLGCIPVQSAIYEIPSVIISADLLVSVSDSLKVSQRRLCPRFLLPNLWVVESGFDGDDRILPQPLLSEKTQVGVLADFQADSVAETLHEPPDSRFLVALG